MQWHKKFNSKISIEDLSGDFKNFRIPGACMAYTRQIESSILEISYKIGNENLTYGG